MIILKRLNVVRKVATEERAAKLESLGFTRTGGAAEAPAGTGISRDDFAKMGEAMYERLSENLKAAVANATASGKGKGGKDGKKEGQDGGTDQQGGGDGAERPEAGG